MNNNYQNVNMSFLEFCFSILYERKYLFGTILFSVLLAVYLDTLCTTSIIKYITHKTDLFQNFILISSCYLINGFLSNIIDKIVSFIISHNNQWCKKLLFEHLLTQESMFFFNQNEGHIVGQIGKLNENLNDILKIITDNLFYFCQIILYIIIIFIKNKIFALFLFIYLFVVIIISYLFNKKISKIVDNICNKSDEIFDYINDCIKNILVRKTFNTHRNEQFKFNNLLQEQKILEQQSQKWINLNRLTFYILGGSIVSIMYYLNYSYFLNHGDISLENYQKFYLTFVLMTGALWQIQIVIIASLPISGLFEAAKMAFHNLKTNVVYDRESILMPKEFIIKLKNVSMIVDHISFLKNANMTIKKGDHLLIVGKSGSGKTKLSLLIMAIIKSTKGKITINNHNIMKIKHEELIKKISFCPQNCVLYQNTIKYNITLGDTYSEENYKKAIKIALVDEFINRIPQKELFNVGSGGNKLSGGQKQRICIARAVLKILEGAEILILDEVFTSLDKHMSIAIAKNLIKIVKHKTTICIDHIGIWESVWKKIINKTYLLENNEVYIKK